jgi:hypothetical protein
VPGEHDCISRRRLLPEVARHARRLLIETRSGRHRRARGMRSVVRGVEGDHGNVDALAALEPVDGERRFADLRLVPIDVDVVADDGRLVGRSIPRKRDRGRPRRGEPQIRRHERPVLSAASGRGARKREREHQAEGCGGNCRVLAGGGHSPPVVGTVRDALDTRLGEPGRWSGIASAGQGTRFPRRSDPRRGR